MRSAVRGQTWPVRSRPLESCGMLSLLPIAFTHADGTAREPLSPPEVPNPSGLHFSPIGLPSRVGRAPCRPGREAGGQKRFSGTRSRSGSFVPDRQLVAELASRFGQMLAHRVYVQRQAELLNIVLDLGRHRTAALLRIVGVSADGHRENHLLGALLLLRGQRVLTCPF